MRELDLQVYPYWWIEPYGDYDACWGCGLAPDHVIDMAGFGADRPVCRWCEQLLPDRRTYRRIKGSDGRYLLQPPPPGPGGVSRRAP